MVYEISQEEFRDFLEPYMIVENGQILKRGSRQGQLAFHPLPEPLSGEPDEGAIIFADAHGHMYGMVSLYSARMKFQEVMTTAENPEAIEPGDVFKEHIFRPLEESAAELSKKETMEERARIIHEPKAALGCLLPAICNTNRDSKMLENLPHRDVLDLSVYYKILIQPEAEYGKLDFVNTSQQTGTVTLTMTLLAEWEHMIGREISEEMLFDMAAANAKEAHRVREPAFGYYGMNLSEQTSYAPGNLYVSTNAFGWLGGADAFLGIGLDAMSEANHTDIYIVPTSIHESVLVPADDSTAPEDVAGICLGDGPFQTDTKDWLSDNVYRYDRNTKEIQITYDAEAMKKERKDGMELLFGRNYAAKAPRRGR